ncbi:catalase [Rhodococcus sp. NPDC054953]
MADTSPRDRDPVRDPKNEQLEPSRLDRRDTRLTTQQAILVDQTDDSLTAGERGPTLLEDFHFREKLTHFDHERIPERVVHARGAGAYGHFAPYDDRLAQYTRAEFLTDPDVRTPVFVRFSTVAGSRGSADTVRDVRGFATKFYTRQGNHDLVGNNFPVFFIQDGIKFPDLIHAVKPEPDNEIPQAQSAHDTFWDFVGAQPETLHAVMWLMSDRAIPRSYRMMQGFGVHTFRLVDADGRGTFVKFHWRPLLGTHSLVWDECQQIAGRDPDFNRRDLWEAIEAGGYPRWELGVQLIPEADEHTFDFDLLDATKLVPEEEVPVQPVGVMVLDRNPDNFFAETEQVAFHTANIVPGIDFTDDPLLQARNFSYLDTQLIRLGGPNFAQLPVNRPVADVVTNQQDGYGQQRIPMGRTAYSTNTLGGGCPALAADGAFTHYRARVDGPKLRVRAEKFRDHYGQPRLFWNSMSGVERDHIVSAFGFELGKVRDADVRVAVLAELNLIDHDLAARVAPLIGSAAPDHDLLFDTSVRSPALSQAGQEPAGIETRRVAILAADGVDVVGVRALRAALHDRGAVTEVLGPAEAEFAGGSGGALRADRAIATMNSVLYDAVVAPCGPTAVATLVDDPDAVRFVREAYLHAKPIAAFGAGMELLRRAEVSEPLAEDVGVVAEHGVVTSGAAAEELPAELVERFADALSRHRAWDRFTGA